MNSIKKHTLIPYFLFLICVSLIPKWVVASEEEGVLSHIQISPKFQAADKVGPIKMVNEAPYQVLQMMSDLSGRPIIPENNLAEVKINFNSQGKLRRDEAIYALENLLSLHGILINRLDAKFLKAINKKNVFNHGLEILDNLGSLEQGSEKFYGKLFRVMHLNSNDALQQIRPLVRKSVGGIFHYQQSNSFMVYESLSTLRQVQQILERIDMPPSSRFKVFFFPLKNVSAKNIRNNLVVLQRNGLREQLKQHLFLNDNRTNQIIATILPENESLIKNIVHKLDEEINPLTSSKVFYLEHAMSQQVYSSLNNIIRNQRRIWDKMGFRQTESSKEIKSFEEDNEKGSSSVQQSELPEEVEFSENSNATYLDASQESSLMYEEGMPELQFSPYAVVIADKRANSIIVYGTEKDINRVGTLIQELDKDVAPLTTSKIFFLSHAQSPTLTRMIASLINTQRNNFRREGFQYAGARNTNEMSMSNIEQDVEFSPYASVISDTRSNSIMTYGTASDIARISKMILDLDVDVAPLTKSRTFSIKHGIAVDMSRTIQQIVSTQQRIRKREASNRKTFLKEPEDEGNSLSNQDIVFELDSVEGLNVDERQFSPYISIVADARSNAIVAYGTDNDLRQVADLIHQIDVVLNQVRIEVVIAEVGLTDLQVSGLESFGIDFKKPAAGLITPGNYNVSSSTPSLGDSGSPALSMQTSLKDFSLSAVLNKAKEDRNVKILSSPTIVTTHNHRASINVGEARPIITSSTSNLNNSDLATRSTVEYRDIGITLRVRPLIGDNNVVQMEIEQIVETVVDTQTIDNNIQPIIGTRRATSFVSIKDQETLIMAGLQSVESSDSKGKVYLLGSIPIVGKLFSPKSKKETTRELIIFIKPIVVQQEQAQGNKSFQEDIRSEMLKRDVQEFLGGEEAP